MPVTISGFIIGILVTAMTDERMKPFLYLLMPTAAAVPSTVAMTDDVTARIMVL